MNYIYKCKITLFHIICMLYTQWFGILLLSDLPNGKLAIGYINFNNDKLRKKPSLAWFNLFITLIGNESYL